MVQGALGHDLGRPERASPMNQEDFRGKPSEKYRFLGRGVPPADHANRHIPVKRPVASRAGGHPMPFEFALLLEAEPFRRSATGDNHRLGVDWFAVDMETIVAVQRLECAYLSILEFGAEFFGLPMHVHDQLRAADSLGETGKILHQSGARKLAAWFSTFQDERIQVGARGVNR